MNRSDELLKKFESSTKNIKEYTTILVKYNYSEPSYDSGSYFSDCSAKPNFPLVVIESDGTGHLEYDSDDDTTSFRSPDELDKHLNHLVTTGKRLNLYNLSKSYSVNLSGAELEFLVESTSRWVPNRKSELKFKKFILDKLVNARDSR